MADHLIRLAGLFECESPAGNRYFTGLLNGGAKLVMLKNNYKQADNEPDWNLYLTERQRQDVGDSSKASAEVQHEKPKPRKRRARRTKAPAAAPHEDDPNDDISDLLEAG